MAVQLQSLGRDRILAIARRHGVTKVKVFGSFARGEAGPQTTPFFPGGLVTALEEALGRRVDGSKSRSCTASFATRIHAEAIAL